MKRKLFFLLQVILFFYASSARQNKALPGETYAIVVGISSYHYIKPLNYADRDADLFTDLLRSAVCGPIKEENLFLLKNDSANAGNFWSALLRICNKDLHKGDRVYIYFAGHGDAIKGLNEYYLLLSDCQPANDGNNYLLSFGAIDMYHLKNRIGTLTGKGVEVILVLDACRTNELAGGYASQVFNSSIIQTKVGEIDMLATGPGQVSIEDASFGRGHGLFTYNLVDALSGLADKEEQGNNDHVISLDEIQYWVSKKVQLISEKFKVRQSPTFCCEEKNNMQIGIVDSSFSIAWNQLKQLNDNSTAMPAGKAQRNNDLVADTGLLALYNNFNAARKENRLWGNASADQYYDQMEKQFPAERITEDARYAIASDFINFGQQKLNLYLEGKDLLSIENLREKNDSAQTPRFLSDEYERLQNTVSEKWTITARMIQKAGKLLSSKGDSTLFYQLKPRVGFLFARGYINREKENELRYEDALKYALEAYKADSNAAYTAECLGILYAYRHSLNRGLGITEYELGTTSIDYDTSMNYLRKAIRLAPKWINPCRSIALKIYGVIRSDSALTYLHRALSLGPDDGTSHVMIGDIYRQLNPDSAMYYFRKALALSGTSSHAMIYRKMARVFLEAGYVRNSPAFKPDSVMAYSKLALAADLWEANDASHTGEVLATVYMDITSMYFMQQQPDAALPYYFKVIDLFPKHERANLFVIGYYSTHNMKEQFLHYSYRFLMLAPENATALLGLARYYDDMKIIDSAILYYERSLKITKSKDMPRERLAYLLMGEDKNDTRPLDYFMETLNEFPSGWRSYFNIACYYANRGENEKAIEFLEKTLSHGMKNKSLLDTDPYISSLKDSNEFRKIVAKYFPE